MTKNDKKDSVVAIIQARMGSKRMPGKVLKDLAGHPVLFWVTRAASNIVGVDKVVVATSTDDMDNAIVEWCENNDIAFCRGSQDDVLSRFHLAAEIENASTIIRLTADCPFLDSHVCGQVLALFQMNDADYATNRSPASWPDGLDCEVFKRSALDRAMTEAKKPSEREHVTPFIHSNRLLFKVVNLPCPIPNLESKRWTLDTINDYDKLQKIASNLPKNRAPNLLEVLNVTKMLPDTFVVSEEERDAGYAASLAAEKNETSRTFDRTNEYLKRALKTIPIGSQTFSKSHLQYPTGETPLFISHASGGRVWDVDSNEYVDMICALFPVALGYCDRDVDNAIRAQLDKGISFSLASELEVELSERLVNIIPCAEMVRFGKNGTDATSAAIRLSRAFTKRERVLVAGYHGWQDWYIGSTSRHAGVPKGVQELTHRVSFNDLEQVEELLKTYPGEIAAMILEPMNIVEPAPGYLANLKKLLHKHGAILIFDEIITGFRFSLGGAQKLFGVTPDLAAFGKALGNGMPISAIVGRKDIMLVMEDIFFSGTFGGEALSLAASIAVIDKMQREPVINTIWETGKSLQDGISSLIKKFELQDVIKLHGRAPWTALEFVDQPNARKEAIKTLYMRHMLANGVLTLGIHSICYAHSAVDIAQVLDAYERTFPILVDELSRGGLEVRLPSGAIEPVFKVR